MLGSLRKHHLQAGVFQGDIVRHLAPEGLYRTVCACQTQHKHPFHTPSYKSIENRFTIEHFGQVWELRERSDEILDTARCFACTPQVIWPIRQQGLSTNGCVLNAGAAVRLDLLKQRLTALHRDLESLDLI